MKPYEFTRFYHPRLGRFVFKHKRSGIIIDNIFKPVKGVLSSVFKKFAKPIAKKALESGISHTGERLGKKISEKSGDLIMKKLANMRQRNTYQKTRVPNPPVRQEEESTDMILNHLISGNGMKRRRKFI